MLKRFSRTGLSSFRLLPFSPTRLRNSSVYNTTEKFPWLYTFKDKYIIKIVEKPETVTELERKIEFYYYNCDNKGLLKEIERAYKLNFASNLDINHIRALTNYLIEIENYEKLQELLNYDPSLTTFCGIIQQLILEQKTTEMAKIYAENISKVEGENVDTIITKTILDAYEQINETSKLIKFMEYVLESTDATQNSVMVCFEKVEKFIRENSSNKNEIIEIQDLGDKYYNQNRKYTIQIKEYLHKGNENLAFSTFEHMINNNISCPIDLYEEFVEYFSSNISKIESNTNFIKKLIKNFDHEFIRNNIEEIENWEIDEKTNMIKVCLLIKFTFENFKFYSMENIINLSSTIGVIIDYSYYSLIVKHLLNETNKEDYFENCYKSISTTETSSFLPSNNIFISFFMNDLLHFHNFVHISCTTNPVPEVISFLKLNSFRIIEFYRSNKFILGIILFIKNLELCELNPAQMNLISNSLSFKDFINLEYNDKDITKTKLFFNKIEKFAHEDQDAALGYAAKPILDSSICDFYLINNFPKKIFSQILFYCTLANHHKITVEIFKYLQSKDIDLDYSAFYCYYLSNSRILNISFDDEYEILPNSGEKPNIAFAAFTLECLSSYNIDAAILLSKKHPVILKEDFVLLQFIKFYMAKDDITSAINYIKMYVSTFSTIPKEIYAIATNYPEVSKVLSEKIKPKSFEN